VIPYREEETLRWEMEKAISRESRVMAEMPEMLVSVTKIDIEVLAELIAQKVYEKLEAADDAREAAARPVDECPECGEKGKNFTTQDSTGLTYACPKGHGKWTVEQ